MVNTTLPIVPDTGGQVMSMLQFGWFLIALGLFLCGYGAGLWSSARRERRRAQSATPDEWWPAALPIGVEGFPIPTGHASDATAATPFSHRGRHMSITDQFNEITAQIQRPDGAG